MNNFELGCFAFGLLMIAPELVKIARLMFSDDVDLTKESK